jgi:hypothetical protein
MVRSFLTPTALVAALVLTACGDPPTTALEEGPLLEQAAAPANGSAVAALGGDLAALQQATAHYHKIDNALAAGYVQLTPCLESPAGAQGYHYGNPALIDGNVSVTEPEILLYEPQAGGHLRLVGVEYVVPLNLPEPAPLFGQHFHANAAVGLWALHVWNWRNSPNGLFADWNAKVSCAHAS